MTTSSNAPVHRIGPFEVESALLEHPSVLECSDNGCTRSLVRGQVVKATLILARGYSASDSLVKELQNHVKRVTGSLQISPYRGICRRASQDGQRKNTAEYDPESGFGKEVIKKGTVFSGFPFHIYPLVFNRFYFFLITPISARDTAYLSQL